MTSLFTIGYEGHTPETFFKRLVDHDIDVLIDVRERAGSRKPGFSKTQLQEMVAWGAINYAHVREVGTPAELRRYLKERVISREEYLVDYKAHLANQDEHVEKVLQMVCKSRCCLMCLEANPEDCHRSILADVLVERSEQPLEVYHIVNSDCDAIKAIMALPLPGRLEQAGFERHELDREAALYEGSVPAALKLSGKQFEQLWNSHPDEHREIRVAGRVVKAPRWEQAFGHDYRYSGQVNQALPIPRILQKPLGWCQQTVDSRLNGVMVVWYDGSQGHYIGRHRDSTTDLVPGAPIVTLSFGEERIFRLRPWGGRGYQDFAAVAGSVLVLPYETNQSWTHEVPHFVRFQGQRISVTMRAFAEQEA